MDGEVSNIVREARLGSVWNLGSNPILHVCVTCSFWCVKRIKKNAYFPLRTNLKNKMIACYWWKSEAALIMLGHWITREILEHSRNIQPLDNVTRHLGRT